MGPYRNGNAVSIQTHYNKHRIKGSLAGAFFRLSTQLTVFTCVN